jgi:GxxExxY protein
LEHEPHEKFENKIKKSSKRAEQGGEMVKESGNTLLYKEECYFIQGAIFEVYRELGCGFSESVYQAALEKELELREIPFKSQPEILVSYKGELLHQTFKPDFVCYDKIILELKATKDTLEEHKAQIINYLKIVKFRLGLLVNFGHYPRVTVQRIIV